MLACFCLYVYKWQLERNGPLFSLAELNTEPNILLLHLQPSFPSHIHGPSTLPSLQASMSSSLCQCYHSQVPRYLEVLPVLLLYFLLTQTWNLCYCNSSLPVFFRFKSVCLTSFLQDSLMIKIGKRDFDPNHSHSSSSDLEQRDLHKGKGFSLLTFSLPECRSLVWVQEGTCMAGSLLWQSSHQCSVDVDNLVILWAGKLAGPVRL